MSAPSASETPSTANSLARDRVASLRTVQLPGSPATYANRTTLREMGLRWDPVGHRWHGTTTAAAVKTLREQLYLEVPVFGVLKEAPKGPTGPKPVFSRPVSVPTSIPIHDPARRPHDGKWTEARVAFPSLEEPDEIVTPGRRFSFLEITSGLADDSRESDEKETERRIRELRARVKRARTIVATTPGLAEILHTNWKKAARFYARFAITEEMFRRGVPPGDRTGECVATKTWSRTNVGCSSRFN